MSSDYVTSFALKQKMLHFLQNLEYHMTFEVLEPNWVEMIAKIQSGKVANVDQVRFISLHSFNNCGFKLQSLYLTFQTQSVQLFIAM